MSNVFMLLPTTQAFYKEQDFMNPNNSVFLIYFDVSELSNHISCIPTLFGSIFIGIGIEGIMNR